MTDQDRKAIAALNTISYGLYVISSRKDGKINAQCGNTLFQITATPRQVAIGINKHNYTYEFITSSGVMAVSVLNQNQIHYVRHFGLQSGRRVDKFATVKYVTRSTGCPILPDALACIECRVNQLKCLDCGTHMIFVCDVVEADILNPGEALTYELYRRQLQ